MYKLKIKTFPNHSYYFPSSIRRTSVHIVSNDDHIITIYMITWNFDQNARHQTTFCTTMHIDVILRNYTWGMYVNCYITILSSEISTFLHMTNVNQQHLKACRCEASKTMHCDHVKHTIRCPFREYFSKCLTAYRSSWSLACANLWYADAYTL